ncbi:putative F-box/LRR-repeat protein [Drosera capensis]
MANDGEDFFARLPDCLLILIISFLPLKEAVRKSILAKRWRQLWRFIPYMELDEHHFTRLGAANHKGNDQEEQLLQFFNFANTWIENYTNQTMGRFSLLFSRPHDYPEVMLRFIDFATRHGARHLELDFTGPAQGTDVLPIRPENIPVPFDLPDCVHWFESFNLLKLSACVFNVTNFVNLGTLRSLYLGWVEITSTMIRQIMESCTVLESLSLVKCYGETQFMIMSSGLRKLIIDKCCDLLVLFVWTPNLRSFKYSGTVVEFGIVEFPELEEADVDLRLSPYYDDSNANRIASLLVHLRHAKTLSVCSYVTQDNEDYGVLPLNFAPDTFWLSIEQPVCLKDTLKVVEINGFRGIEYESCFARFLHCHGRVLDTLKLRVDNTDQPPRAPIVQRLGNLNAVVEYV